MSDHLPPVVEPVITNDGSSLGGEKWTHPAYGALTVSRVSGRTNLFRSDFSHQHYINISLYPAELNRSLSRDWVFPYRSMPIVEIALSEAQWATFVSSHNIGEGTPCTIESVEGAHRPRLPAPHSRSDQFKMEADETLQSAVRSIDSLAEMIKELGLPPKKAEALMAHANKARQTLSSNLPFVAKQFEKHVETTVESAKTEVNAYATQVLMRTGLEALGVKSPIEALESNPSPSEK